MVGAQHPDIQSDCELPTGGDGRRMEVRRLLGEYAAHRDEAARDRLVALNAGLVHVIARRFANRGEPVEDLQQVGFLGLVKAIDRFDPSREGEFASFAVPTITGEIRRHFRDASWSVRVPRRLQEVYLRAMRAGDELAQELGTSPSAAQIASRIDRDAGEVVAALEVSPARRAVSLDTSAGCLDGDGGLVLADRLGREDENLARIEMRMLVEHAMTHLSPRERRVMCLRFVDELSQHEVARRLHISQAQVSRLQRAALEHMRRRLGVDDTTQSTLRWVRLDGACILPLIEELRRDTLDPVQRAGVLHRLRAGLGSASWEEVARVIGISRRHIHNLLNVTRLPVQIQETVATHGLTEKHVRALILLRASSAQQARLCRQIQADALSGDAALVAARACA
ncbi:MAG: polymerase, sigma 28 subunit, Sig subfamily [Chloroflexi bacterium]|nr:polymerase, sigma 28 subunit, Sig subfamily [Chloroflexota bacterium]